MKTRFVLSLFLVQFLLMPAVANAQMHSGDWSGKLEFGIMKMTLVLHLDDDNRCTLDSPDQGAFNIKGNVLYNKEDSLAFAIESIGANFSGRVQEGTKIHGIFKQNGISLPLVLEPTKREVKRPQTPSLPLPYKTKEIEFSSDNTDYQFKGILSYPVSNVESLSAVPLVVLVSGSGLQNWDEEVFGHKPFQVIADYPARNGVASFRYNDRGYGQEAKLKKEPTTYDFAEDAEAAVRTVRSLNEFGSIGMLGHSEGASIGFMLASKGEIDYLISMAGIGVKGDSALCEQCNAINKLQGIDRKISVAEYRAQPEISVSRWLQTFCDYDPLNDIQNAKCPVFAINGEKDLQVLCNVNLNGIKANLPDNKFSLVKSYSNLNHLMLHCNTGMPSEYYQIEETISEEVLTDIAKWILGITKKND